MDLRWIKIYCQSYEIHPMEQEFEAFETVKADETTALLATRKDGETVLLSRDWAHVTNTDGEIEAEWEPLVDSLISVSMADFDPSEEITIPLDTALNRIQTSGLIDTSDDEGDLRARATLEYLAERDVIRPEDEKVVLLENLQLSGPEYQEALIGAAVVRDIRRQIEDVIEDVESSELNFEDREEMLEESPLPEFLSIDRSAEMTIDVDSLNDHTVFLEKIEIDCREVAKRLNKIGQFTNIEQVQKRVAKAMREHEPKKIIESDTELKESSKGILRSIRAEGSSENESDGGN